MKLQERTQVLARIIQKGLNSTDEIEPKTDKYGFIIITFPKVMKKGDLVQAHMLSNCFEEDIYEMMGHMRTNIENRMRDIMNTNFKPQ